MKKKTKNKKSTKTKKSKKSRKSGTKLKRKVIKKIKKAKKVKKLKLRLKKSGKVKKPTSREKKKEGLARTADALIEKGRKRGFITYDEILKTFPDIENNILFLDELYERFSIAGIDVLEGGNLLNLDV